MGKERDAESGLYYYGARYYAAWTCRFISVDPLAAKYAHITPYNYADNNPINDFDIDGMQTTKTEKTPVAGTETNSLSNNDATKVATGGVVKQDVEQAMVDIANGTYESKQFQKQQSEQYRKNYEASKEYERTHQLKATEDTQNWKDSHPVAAEILETKKAAQANKDMSVWIWINYWFGKVGEYGAPLEALKKPSESPLLPKPAVTELKQPAKMSGKSDLPYAPGGSSGNGTSRSQEVAPDQPPLPIINLPISDADLVQRAASFADKHVPFKTNAGVTGTLKHQAANRYLHLYQLKFGYRGIETNVYFNNIPTLGLGNRGFLDVVIHSTNTIYDFKFGNATWRSGQLQKYQTNFRGYSISIVRP